MTKSFNSQKTYRKRSLRRPAFGIATDYRIYQDDAHAPNFRHTGGLFTILVSLMALLLGTKTVVTLGASLWRQFTAPLRAELFEILYARKLRRGRYPRRNVAAHLALTVSGHAPVAVYRPSLGDIVCCGCGVLTGTGDRYTVSGTDCCFSAAEVANLFDAPDWFDKRAVIVLR